MRWPWQGKRIKNGRGSGCCPGSTGVPPVWSLTSACVCLAPFTGGTPNTVAFAEKRRAGALARFRLQDGRGRPSSLKATVLGGTPHAPCFSRHHRGFFINFNAFALLALVLPVSHVPESVLILLICGQAFCGFSGSPPDHSLEFLTGQDGSVHHDDEEPAAVVIADLHRPWHLRPSVGSGRVFVEERDGVMVFLESVLLHFFPGGSEQSRTPPRFFCHPIRCQRRPPPGIFRRRIQRNPTRNLRPLAIVGQIRGQRHVQVLQIRHACRLLRTLDRGLRRRKEKCGKDRENPHHRKDLDESEG